MKMLYNWTAYFLGLLKVFAQMSIDAFWRREGRHLVPRFKKAQRDDWLSPGNGKDGT